MSNRWQNNVNRIASVGHSADELQVLCQRVCEESLTPAEGARLEELLVGDRAARAFYLEFMAIHGALQWGAIADGSAADSNEPPTAPSIPADAAVVDVNPNDVGLTGLATDAASPPVLPSQPQQSSSWRTTFAAPRFSLAMSIGVLLLAFTVVAAGERIIRAVFSHSIEAHPAGGLIRNSQKVERGGQSARGTRRIGSSVMDDMGLVNILVFRLPALNDFERVRSARLEWTYRELQGSPQFSVDLYGLGYVSSTSALGGCFWEGQFDTKRRADYGMEGSKTRRVSLIAKRVMAPETPLGRIVVDGPPLVSFLQSLYDDGAKGGELAVFRLNANVTTSQIVRLQAYEVVHPPEVSGRTTPDEFPSLQLTADPMVAGSPTVAEVVLTAHGIEAHKTATLVRSNQLIEKGVCEKGTRRVGSSMFDEMSLANLLVFRLPPLKELERVRAAQLEWVYKQRDGRPNFSVDLYGLGCTTSLSTLHDLFWEGAYDTQLRSDYGMDAVSHRQVSLIAKGVMKPDSPTGKVVVDGPALVDFLQSLYDDGAAGGEWVVFRLNADASTASAARETGYQIVHPPEVPGKTAVKETSTLHLISY